jgi:glutamate dehydrogenase (NADP+)
MAFPCATQNELLEKDVSRLAESGCQVIVEGANMPTSYDGVAKVKELGMGFCPAKATNMGGVAVSGLEMAQNSMRTTWTSQQVEQELYRIMLNSYTNSKKAAQLFLNNPSDLLTGANIFSFLRIATALIQQGCV